MLLISEPQPFTFASGESHCSGVSANSAAENEAVVTIDGSMSRALTSSVFSFIFAVYAETYQKDKFANTVPLNYMVNIVDICAFARFCLQTKARCHSIR